MMERQRRGTGYGGTDDNDGPRKSKAQNKIIYGQSFNQVRSKQYNSHHHFHREDGEEDENHA